MKMKLKNYKITYSFFNSWFLCRSKNKILSIFPKQQQTLLFLVSYCHSECRYSSYLENWIMQIWYVKWNKSSSYECIFNISLERLVGMGCHVSLWWIIYQKFQMFNVKKLSIHNVPWTNVMLNSSVIYVTENVISTAF